MSPSIRLHRDDLIGLRKALWDALTDEERYDLFVEQQDENWKLQDEIERLRGEDPIMEPVQPEAYYGFSKTPPIRLAASYIEDTRLEGKLWIPESFETKPIKTWGETS